MYTVRGSSPKVVENLAINFLTTPFSENAAARYRKNGFLSNQTLTEVFTNKFTSIYTSDTQVTYPTYDTNTVTGTKMADTLKVRAMTLEDIKKVSELTSVSNKTYLTDVKYQKLFNIGADCWLASVYDNSASWLVGSNGKIGYYFTGEYGVRPLVSLKSNVRANTKSIFESWNIEI